MSRDDLVATNSKIMKSVTQEIMQHSKEPIILVLTNPVDAMTYTVYQTAGLPKKRVIGQSGVLDTARFRAFVAEELDVSDKGCFRASSLVDMVMTWYQCCVIRMQEVFH